MSSKPVICHLEQLSDPGSRGFSVEHQGVQIEGFVVHRDGEVFAYMNRCPHTGAPLDWVEHRFLDMDESYIQCAVHDARFQIEDGLCVVGPCSGDSLQPLNIEVTSELIFLNLD